MVRFEDILNTLATQYDVIDVLSDEANPYKKQVILKDSSGNIIVKNYILIGFTTSTDADGNTIVEEDWTEV